MNTKYIVLSGFLGSGKTTSMIAFSKSINNRKLGTAAILVDDLGASNITDYEFTKTSGLICEDISGDCICYQHENLIDKLHQLEKRGADIIFSDIPGLGIGALDNVYLQLNDKEPDEFELLPFTCLVDPERIRMLMPESADLHLPEALKFLLDAQLAEADLIILNKVDTITSERKDEILKFINNRYPSTKLLFMSVKTGEGVDAVVDYILANRAPVIHKEIGYGSKEFLEAEKMLSWYNRRIYMQERNNSNIDFNNVISELFEEVRKGLKANNSNVPHLKMFAADSDDNMTDFFKASLIGIDYPVEYENKLNKEYSSLSLVINARAAASSSVMSDIMDDALDSISLKFNLKIKTFFLEAFGMMEEGKGNIGRSSKF